MRAWIEQDDDHGWGSRRVLVSSLEADGYVIVEITGTRKMLTLWGTEPDPAAVLRAYQ
jgi:hypothetical protein